MQEETSFTLKNKLSILSVALVAFVGILTETSLNVTFPTLMKQMHTNLSTIQWITTGYLLVVALIMVISPYLNRRFKTKTNFIISVSLFVIGNVIAATSNSFNTLLLGRIIAAAGTGIVMPLLFDIIISIVPKKILGYYMGLAGMVLSLGPAFGPSFGGYISFAFNWRMIFWLVVPIGLIAFILGLATITQKEELSKPKFDWLRYIILVVAFVAIIIGFDSVGTKGWINPIFITSLVVVIITVLAFIKLSKNSKKMLINIEVFHSKIFTASLAVYLILQFTNIGINFILPTYAQEVSHANSLVSGMILFPGSIIAALMTPYFGKMLDNYGAKLPIILGNILFIIGSILFVIYGRGLTVILITIFYLIYTIGRSMEFENVMTNALNNIEPQYHSDANALFTTFQQLAGSLGTTVMASIISISQNSGSNLSQNQLTAIGSQNVFILILILVIVNFGLFKIIFKSNNK